MSEARGPIVNVDEVEEVADTRGAPWGGYDRRLTPSMRPAGGRLGVCHSRLPPGHVMCPFHYHQREDEVFFVLSGRGVLRYGDQLFQLREGDCVSCPAGTRTGHQIANPFDADLVYLAIGPHDPDEVCVYPDSGKVMIRGLGKRGFLRDAAPGEGEPSEPKIFELAKALLEKTAPNALR